MSGRDNSYFLSGTVHAICHAGGALLFGGMSRILHTSSQYLSSPCNLSVPCCPINSCRAPILNYAVDNVALTVEGNSLGCELQSLS